MQIKAKSIDHAAGGFLRHRFLRTLAGALFVLLVLAATVTAMAAGASIAIVLATGSFSVVEGLKRLGGAVAIAAASAGAFA